MGSSGEAINVHLTTGVPTQISGNNISYLSLGSNSHQLTGIKVLGNGGDNVEIEKNTIQDCAVGIEERYWDTTPSLPVIRYNNLLDNTVNYKADYDKPGL